MKPDRNAGVKRFLADLTIVTRADLEAQAVAASRLKPDLTDYYPRSFETWPADPGIFAPPLAIDCADLDRGRVS